MKYFGGWVPHEDHQTSRDRSMHEWHENDNWNEVQRTESSRFLEMKLRAQPLYMEG